MMVKYQELVIIKLRYPQDLRVFLCVSGGADGNRTHVLPVSRQDFTSSDTKTAP